MTFGLHRERPTNDWSPQATERCHRIWWTVYILDRTFSFSMGVPISIQDSDITTPMPQPEGPTGQPFLYFHVKLSNLISEVVNSMFLCTVAVHSYISGSDGSAQRFTARKVDCRVVFFPVFTKCWKVLRPSPVILMRAVRFLRMARTAMYRGPLLTCIFCITK